MWKTLNVVVATMANLFQKRSSPSPICHICNAQDESIEHLLLLCPWVEVVWFRGALSIRFQRHEVTTWANWLHACLEEANGSKSDKRRLMSYIAFTCWHIWKTQCNFLFNQQPINLRQVVLAISTSIGAFLDANQSLRTRTTPGTRSPVIPVTWTPPNLRVIKINVEASWEANSSSGFARVVARDHDGHFLGAGKYPVKAGSVAMVEVLAIRHGCELGH